MHLVRKSEVGRQWVRRAKQADNTWTAPHSQTARPKPGRTLARADSGAAVSPAPCFSPRSHSLPPQIRKSEEENPLLRRSACSIGGVSESCSGRCRRCGTRSRGALTRSVPSRKSPPARWCSPFRIRIIVSRRCRWLVFEDLDTELVCMGFAGRRGRSLDFWRSTRTMSSERKLTTARKKPSGY